MTLNDPGGPGTRAGGLSLRPRIVIGLVLVALAGALAGGGWYRGQLDWQLYLDRAFQKGVSLYEVVAELRADRMQAPPAVAGLSFARVTPARVVTADNSESLSFPGVEGLNFETRLSFLEFPDSTSFEGARIPIRIFSDTLKYSSAIAADGGNDALSFRFGMLAQTLAAYCGDTVVFVAIDADEWLRVRAAPVWGCAAAPTDWRLIALIAAGVIFATILTLGMNLADRLAGLARAIGTRAEDGRITPLELRGPPEIRAISQAVNRFFHQEKGRLQRRSTLLAGISHDLGAPATRLKLRTAMIEDPDLRQRLERDIARMLEMIEGVLAYTRTEMDSEAPRRVSLLSLVQSLVDDYADLGLPVTLAPVTPPTFRQPRSVFSTTAIPRRFDLTAQARILCNCQPDAIRRALSNLIDNALKYGKSAEMRLSASAENVEISVQDQGGALTRPDFATLLQPFRRGPNAAQSEGVGLGLTIVANIVANHGGQLRFARNATGTCVTITLPRS